MKRFFKLIFNLKQVLCSIINIKINGKNRGSTALLLLFFFFFSSSITWADENGAIDYTDQLFEVTDTGAYDAQGNIVDPKNFSVLQMSPLGSETFSLSPAAPPLSSLSPAAPPLSSLSPAAPLKPSDDPEAFKEYQSTLVENWGNQAGFARARLGEVQEDIENREKRFEEIRALIDQTQADLEPLEEEIHLLENQLNLYNGQIEQLKSKIRQVENRVAEKKISLRQLMLELNDINVEFELLKEVATDFIRLLHGHESHFTSVSGQKTDSLKLLLSKGTVNEHLVESSYLEIMEQTGRQVFHRLEKNLEEAQVKQNQVEKEQLELNDLLALLLQEKQTLEQVRSSKTELLDETQGRQEEYLRLLKEAEEEQAKLELELSSMEDVEVLLQEQLARLQQGFSRVQGAGSEEELMGWSNVPQVRLTPGGSSNSSTSFQVDPQLLGMIEADLAEGVKKIGLNWPVTPNKVTAQFSDANYVKMFGVDHGGLDMRARQHSPVYSSADGMVVKTRFSGKDYAYVVIAHGNSSLPPEYNGASKGLMTLYGHMSQIDVRAGQIVRRGQLIGLSGGIPGTDGAGLRTTGAHMHFEVREGGSLVDPLEFLILEGVDDVHLPSRWKSTERNRKYWPKGL